MHIDIWDSPINQFTSGREHSYHDEINTSFVYSVQIIQGKETSFEFEENKTCINIIK